jgi:hypothetical protein
MTTRVASILAENLVSHTAGVAAPSQPVFRHWSETRTATRRILALLRQPHPSDVFQLPPQGTPMPTASGDLLATFAREGQREHFQIDQDPDKALKGGIIVLLVMDGLRVGDYLTNGVSEPDLSRRR